MIVFCLVTLIVLYVSWSMLCLERNRRIASRLGPDVTLVLLPVDPLNIPWQIVEPLVFFFLNLLPIDLGTFGIYTPRGWHFRVKADAHVRYGPVWAIVTPVNVWVQVADPAAVTEIFKRRTDFVRAREFYSKSILPNTPRLSPLRERS
jgi:hypothetical protein